MARSSRATQNVGMSESLFAPIMPWDAGWLSVGNGHRIYYEQCGNRAGIPVLMLHGGPGSGSSPLMRRILDPSRFRMVLFDQRGCGRSMPRGELRANHTGALVDDIELLRGHLELGCCLVVGGSWGAALALAWAGRHRLHCLGLLLRAPFLTGDEDLDHFFDAVIPGMPCTLLSGLTAAAGVRSAFPWLPRAVLNAPTLDAARPLLAAWMEREQSLGSCGKRVPRLPLASEVEAWTAAWHKYRIQAHYLVERCFLGERCILDSAEHLCATPVCIVQGGDDLICRPRNAELLQSTLANSQLFMVEGVGHDPFAPAMLAATRASASMLTGAFGDGDDDRLDRHRSSL